MPHPLKEFTPPILLSFGRAVRKALEPKPAPEIRERLQSLKEQFDRNNAGLPGDEFALREGLKFKIHPESRVGLEYFCYRALEVVEEMDCFLALSREKRSFLDIGALHGAFSLAFAAGSTARRTVAVDASPIAFARLLYNVHKNEFRNVIPVECALSDEPGTLRMHYEWEHAVAAGAGSGTGLGIEVKKRTGDDLCDELGMAPDLVKIDVEGHELKVVKGLEKILGKCRPLVFLELHPGRMVEENDSIADLVKAFTSKGYTASLVTGRAVSTEEIVSFKYDQRLVFTPGAGV